MATPVKETPILLGKDARRFKKATEANKNKTITPQERQRILDAWQTIKVVKPQRV